MKHKIIFHKILFFTIVCIVFFGTVMTYKATKDLVTAYEWKGTIESAMEANDEANFLLEKSLLEADYDAIMRHTAEFQKALKKLDSSNLISFEKLALNEKTFSELEEAVEKRVELTDKLNSVTIMAKLVYNEIILKFEALDGLYFNELMPQILMFRYDLNTDLAAPKKLLNEYLKNPKLTKNDVGFLSSAQKLIGHYEQAQKLYRDIILLGIYNKLSDLKESSERYIQNVLSNLRRTMALVFVLFGLASIFVYISYARARNNIRLLNRFEQAVDNSFNAITFTDLDRKVKYVNKIFEQNFGYKFEELKDQNINIIKSHQHSNEFYQDMLKTIESDQIWRADELISRTKSGALIHEQVIFSPLFNESGDKDGYMSIKYDKTKELAMTKELENKNKELQNEALKDKLTGLGSYFALTQRMEQGSGGMIIYININNFMDFRFFYKTKTVDAIIASFATTLQLCIDTYKIDANIYRVQFDEFCIWYGGDDAERVVRKFIDYFKANNLYITVEGAREFIPNIKITIGVSLPQDTPQTNRLTQAMLAHHEAKQNGETVQFYTENSHIEQQYYHNQIMSRTIENALYNDTVIVECQPIYDVSGEKVRVKYYEVLVRLIDENGKIRYPGEFLDIAKKISLYNDITKKVIEHVFRLVEKFTNTSFSMNLSSSDIANESIRELIEKKLRVCSRPEHVYFEILESEGVDDYKIVNDFINKIRAYDCKISIDDFGSGYSNYYRILELDIDTIKIDGSIIKKLPYDKNARYLLQTIIDFAGRQGYNVVAEFVSSEEILAEIKKFGIKYAQGFLLGKPTSPSNIEE
ncbi:GGDEF domain-containing phosphodiesterase [uncultured Campylobacter sp.]|uniref:bifunctional diguanylate cyclase/phosphodiesterase n=1 Tax=uncultured Campylobacter sp. TaxID=218934 RepID=UPI0026033A2E|nr:GGDEF domain-containing phosphodiesterase [uncultured Campylobacter sp.]